MEMLLLIFISYVISITIGIACQQRPTHFTDNYSL